MVYEPGADVWNRRSFPVGLQCVELAMLLYQSRVHAVGGSRKQTALELTETRKQCGEQQPVDHLA